MMMISPTHRLMLMYDIDPNQYSDYYRYMLGEFVPMMQELNLHMIYAWQVVSDHYPERQVEFVCEGLPIMLKAFQDARFIDGEARLRGFTTTYQRKLVAFENRVQI